MRNLFFKNLSNPRGPHKSSGLASLEYRKCDTLQPPLLGVIEGEVFVWVKSRLALLTNVGLKLHGKHLKKIGELLDAGIREVRHAGGACCRQRYETLWHWGDLDSNQNSHNASTPI